MNRKILDFLCDPVTAQPLTLHEPVYEPDGTISSGYLQSPAGVRYPIRKGIPRFVEGDPLLQAAESFGDEWNFFNFTDFKVNWLSHTVRNTFGSQDVFKGKLIVDAGGGSGAQTLWMLEAGAEHVILLDLSHSVDDVVLRNLRPTNFKNYDVIQCSIDAPPLRNCSIDGIVYCHNVIQHTPSVEKTARALFNLVAPSGEFVFNCYPVNDQGILRWLRFHVIYRSLRAVLSRMPFSVILGYSRVVGGLRQFPIFGSVLEKMGFCTQGHVPFVDGEKISARLRRRYKATVLNTFDYFGSHTYQHHKTDQEIRDLAMELQPNQSKILNLEKYFARPAPIGCALRVQR